MRNTKKAFLSCAIVAAAGLLGATPAMATGGYCTSPAGGTIAVVSIPLGSTVPGACPVENPAVPACVSQGDWTGIQYKVTGGQSTDIVSTLVTVNNAPLGVYLVAGHTLKPDCQAAYGGGDSTTDLGQYSCHERALRIKVIDMIFPDQTSGKGFWVLVQGNKQAIPTAFAQKRGSCPIKTTNPPILGLGLEVELPIAITEIQQVTAGACTGILSTPRIGPSTLEIAPGLPTTTCVVVDNGVPFGDVTISTPETPQSPGHSATGLQIPDTSWVSKGSCCWSAARGGRLYTFCDTSVDSCE